MIQKLLVEDTCIKCNVCTAACPIVPAATRFKGPKTVGPQKERFRHRHQYLPGDSIEWCTGCGICSVVCPQKVPVAEINIQSQSRLVKSRQATIRDHLISRPEIIPGFSAPLAQFANLLIQMPLVRWVLEIALGISRHAPLPTFARTSLRKRFRNLCVDTVPKRSGDKLRVAYFHGCSTNYYEPELGKLTIAIFEKLGIEVFLPPQVCCGLPLQSNGLFRAARRYALTNIESLSQFAKQGIPIIGTSTSCTLSLKHGYRTILDIDDKNADLVATSTFDIFEFLTLNGAEYLQRLAFNPIQAHALYHPPCQLRSHGIGFPALTILRSIPKLEIDLSEAACCGIAGTYGMKKERIDVALNVGKDLIHQALQTNAEFVITDSETCRWWISKQTGLHAVHPIELLARSLEIS